MDAVGGVDSDEEFGSDGFDPGANQCKGFGDARLGESCRLSVSRERQREKGLTKLFDGARDLLSSLAVDLRERDQLGSSPRWDREGAPCDASNRRVL